MYKLLSKLSLTTAVVVSCLPLAGCFDDSYDLEDIDTTAEIKVNNLVIPVNLDEITLSNIFDLDEESVVKDIDGIYAVSVDGDFSSDAITINAVTLSRPTIPPTTADIVLLGDGTGSVTPVPGIEATFTYGITGFSTTFNYTTSSVDKSIRHLSRIGVDWTIDVRLTVANPANAFKSVAFRGVSLKLPAGLHTPDYANNGGVITLDDITLSPGAMTHSVAIRVDEIDFSRLTPAEYTFTPSADGLASGTLSLNGTIGIRGGNVVAVTNSSATTVPAKTTLTLAPTGNDIQVKSIDGTIRYAITDFNVDPVQLNDLPDLLQQDGTDITISNPRLYLSINNPMAGYGLDASSGLTLTACRNDGSRQPYSLDPGQSIVIGHDNGIAGPYRFCLAPDPSAAGGLAEYAGATPVLYHGLGNVLSGAGLPSSIEVDFDDPCAGPGEVRNFTVPNTLDKIQGSYHFYAPLNLGVGSTIVYDETTDGWSDDTIDKITIEPLKINASVTNSLPFDIVISGYPVDAQGNQCKDIHTGSPVSLGSVTVKAGETSPLSLATTGSIRAIDGVRYYATAKVTRPDVTLRPDATISLTGIKATISGFYIDEL